MLDKFRGVGKTPVFVTVEYAAEKTGLDVEEILALTAFKESVGLDGQGPMDFVIRSKQTPEGLMVYLPDALRVAHGAKAIFDGMDEDQ
jgi:hypothetical protein